MSQMSIAKILLPVDFHLREMGAAHQAVGLARDFGAEVTLLHVNPILSPNFKDDEFHGPVDTGWITALELERLQALKEYALQTFEGTKTHCVVTSGDPAAKIIEQAALDKADLIVMPTHGYGAFRRYLLGSVTAKVLHDAPCPVWTGAHLEEPTAQSWRPIHRVLCAVDLGSGSDTIVNWAWHIATKYGAAMETLHVIPRVDLPDPTWIISLTEHVEEKLDTLLTMTGAQNTSAIRSGDAAEEIAKEAQQMRADLIVIGRSRERSEPGRLRAGAYSIIRDAPCPVISV
jgi:nucleotide-binding universal stress UspA family protein